MAQLLIHSSELAAAAKQWALHDVLIAMPATEAELARQALALAERRLGQLPAHAARVLLLGVIDDDQRGLVAMHNLIFKATQSTWYGYLAQDAFAGRAWLEIALAQLERTQAHLLGFNDGKWQGQIAAFGLARRDWAQAIYSGDFFYPGYRSHFADAELTLIAREQKAYTYDPHAVMVEVDPHKDAKAVDASDRSMYLTRLKTGFASRVHDPQLLQLIR